MENEMCEVNGTDFCRFEKKMGETIWDLRKRKLKKVYAKTGGKYFGLTTENGIYKI